MGNVPSGSTLTRTTAALDSFIAELGNDIVYEKSLGSARFLKTVKCRHCNGHLVVKIFIKPDPGLSLRNYHKRFKFEREALQDLGNIYNYQSFFETDKAGYIVRQWVASSLYDRISTRPFLSVIEKKWIAFQILHAMRDARNRKVSHGDIKSENILVTSWNWVYVSDFASFKPAYLPLDDPADFSFFFDTSGRRTCYIAPERFYTASTNPDISARKSKLFSESEEGKRDGKVTEAMDCFSVGCVFAELFLEGTPLFTLSQLFKYREGDYNVDSSLNVIEDIGVRNMIRQMISLDPAQRPSFDTLLHTLRGAVFPETFYSFLHNYVSSVNELPEYSPFSATPMPSSISSIPSSHQLSSPLRSTTSSPLPAHEIDHGILPSDSDNRVERIWTDYDSVEAYIASEITEATIINLRSRRKGDSAPSPHLQEILPVELNIPNHANSLNSTGVSAPAEDGPALIILSLLSANTRNCFLPSSKLRALDLYLALSFHLTDEAKLDRMVPYVVELLFDENAIVRSSALKTLVQILMLVIVITPSNAFIFPEYIIPNTSHLVQDPETSVRCTHAQCISHLADTAVRYLEMGQALKAHGAYKLSSDAQESEQARSEVSYEASMVDLQNSIQEHLSALLMDPSSVVKRAVLHNISSLCIFLGRQKTNDVLLSHMITYLNDRDWLLRYAFFESIVDVAACAGGRSLEEYILPLMVQALSDVEETVVARVLSTLTSLCELGLFQKIRIWELMSATLGFLYHPNVWIRQGAACFLSVASKHLPESDIWCILYPSLRHFLKMDLTSIDEHNLLMALKPPLSRPVFTAAVEWARMGDKSVFWKSHRRSVSRVESPRETVASLRKSVNPISKARSAEEEVQFARLQALGMTPAEEMKLNAMRDYIQKLANAISSFSSRATIEVDAERALRTIGTIELQKLDVVPRTVFLKSRPNELTAPRLSRVSSRRETLDLTPQSPRSPHHSGLPHLDVPFGSTSTQDLRRRLAAANSSNTSATSSPAVTPHGILSLHPPTTVSLSAAAAVLEAERPSSPTESVVSTTDSAVRSMHKLHIGTGDNGKAAPAVGSSRTTATGLLEAPSLPQVRSDDYPASSSRRTSFSTSNTPRNKTSSLPLISTYDGNEVAINNLLENLYLDNNRELQQDFGPRVHEGPVRRRGVVRPSYSTRDGTSRNVEAKLVANLTSHSAAITGLVMSPDHMFFISASDDMTLKVWDTARLERNVTSKPRHTYSQHHGKIKCVCILDGVHCFASAADNGSLHVVRVHVSQSGVLPKYGKLQVIREHHVENIGEYITCMVHYETDAASNLLYATTHSTITLLDLRTMRVLQSMQNPRHFGPITAMCVDRKRCWFIVGTSTGVLSLWDRRFGLLLKSWRVGNTGDARCRIQQCVIHPSKGRGKWVIVALEAEKTEDEDTEDHPPQILLEVWDVENTVLVETFATRSMTNAGAVTLEKPPARVNVDAEVSPAAAIAAFVKDSQSPAESSKDLSSIDTPFTDHVPQVSRSIRAMQVGLDFGGHSSMPKSDLGIVDISTSSRTAGRGFILSGSDDRKIRIWDLGRIERSVVLTGLNPETERAIFSTSKEDAASHTEMLETRHNADNLASKPPQRMSIITHNQQHLLGSHHDIITAITCLDSPFKGGIVSGDRAGVIKVWRVDGWDH